MSEATSPQDDHEEKAGDVGCTPKSATKDVEAEDAGEIKPSDGGGEESKALNEIPGFDDNATYFPVFCLIEVPNEVSIPTPSLQPRRLNCKLIQYFHNLAQLTDPDNLNACLEITSSSSTSPLSEIKHNLTTHQRPHPFLNQTPDDAYTWFKSHLRPDIDYVGPGMQFTSFTFLAVGAACRSSSPHKVLLCTDAPDFGERAGVEK